MRKIKKLVATLLAATMVMAMGVTAFAADSLADGKYTAKQNLYKNSACTTTSMGDYVKQAAVPKSAAACFN